uniref:Actin n=1 Tax=Panagrellus redivivus TaxID=6233 RepID=A0A7E4V4X5_PANRE
MVRFQKNREKKASNLLLAKRPQRRIASAFSKSDIRKCELCFSSSIFENYSFMTDSVYSGDDVSAVVFDLGSSSIRAGYGGLYASPQVEIPSTAGVKDPGNGDKKTYFIGDPNVGIARASTELKRYIRNANVSDWDLFEVVFENIMNYHLRFDITQVPVLFIESNVYNRQHREKLAEIMFEKFNAQAICVMPSAPLIAMKRDHARSTIVDVGHDGTTVSVVSRAYLLRNSVVSSSIGTDYFASTIGTVLDERGTEILPPAAVELHPSCLDYRQKAVLHDFAASTLMYSRKPLPASGPVPGESATFELPTRKEVTFDARTRFSITEGLFNPSYLVDEQASGHKGLVSMIRESVDNIDPDSILPSYSHIFVNGGGALIKNFVDRLQNELNQLPPRISARVNNGVKVYDPRFDAWRQGAIFVGTGTSGQLWCSKSQFRDGSSILHHF